MLIYVSGPYSKNGNGNTTKENIQQAANIAGKLWSMGHAVICPHTNTGEPYLNLDNCNASYDDYIRGDLRMICHCDALVMTPDWETSKGAIIEFEYAQSLGIPIWTYPNVPELHPTEIRCPEQVKAFAEITGKMYRLHLSKNADYSPMNILVTGHAGVVTRLWDKVARLLNLNGYVVKEIVDEDSLYKNIFHSMLNLLWTGGVYARVFIEKVGLSKAPKHESINDTLIDLANYGVIGFLLRQDKWGK